jgi:hypothetical protein
MRPFGGEPNPAGMPESLTLVQNGPESACDRASASSFYRVITTV